MQLRGKQVLLTGSNRGMGVAFAEQLASQGCHLHLLARDISTSDSEHYLRLGAASVRCWQVDMADPGSIRGFLAAFEQSGSAVDILVNNAGFFTAGLLEEQPVDDIYQMLSVNLAGLIHLTRGLLPGMLRQGRGKIVNNASISGRNFFPCSSTYAASKAGVVAFTESIKQELRGTGVSTLLLMTAGVKTDMFDSMEGFFGDKMNLERVSAVSAQVWASKLIAALKDDREVLMPGGVESLLLHLGRHFPALFQLLVRTQFRRSPGEQGR